uniref:Uncharacterized protein n=1 Tax=Arion vulgaris TaxID=1028688 RepID=A0A0B6ZRX2_9EUPU
MLEPPWSALKTNDEVLQQACTQRNQRNQNPTIKVLLTYNVKRRFRRFGDNRYNSGKDRSWKTD